ncbi:MAG: thrombospondin type 3 repeat-containing protein [Bradymonadia bacterium]
MLALACLTVGATAHGQALTTDGTCGGNAQPTGFVNDLGGTEVHALGVYQGSRDAINENGQREINVGVSRAGVPMILVLSSYEPVHWRLNLAPGVQLQQVILNGYNNQTLEGHGGAVVTDRTRPGNYFTACAYVWPSGNGGCDTNALISGVEGFLGQSVDSFHGCYTGEAFAIGAVDGDGDAVPDASDACPEDPDNDIDGDGVCGNVDNCSTTSNSSQSDSDNDGIGDACDACPFDRNNDADGDGVCGDVDNCPNFANADQSDNDNDGVCGNVDNCPNTTNADQTDSDGDGIGDSCDACHLDADNDIDGDGLCGNVDNCPIHSNADQADGDGDGIGDICDIDYAVEGACHNGGDVTGFANATSDTEVHLFGVYESALNRGFRQHPRGDVDVNITRTGVPMILVMSSYEPTNWRLNLAPGAQVQQIILNGYYTQTVEGHGDIPVLYKHEPGNYFTACAYVWPSGNGGCDTNALINGVEGLLNLEVTSFHGCYGSTGFTLGPSAPDTDGDGTSDDEDPCPNDPADDADGDGVCGDVDNCPTTSNAAQTDGDGDGAGDACDACPSDADDDIDSDGVCGDVDNCPNRANAAQADSNGDGAGDACDIDMPVSAVCESGALSGFDDGDIGASEVHVVGIYESRGDHSGGFHPRGDTRVEVNRTGVPITLVLSSYEPTHWTLALAPGVQLQQVILNGYHTQTIEGHGGAPVTFRHEPGNYYTACAYVWPSGNGGCDTNALISGIEGDLGLPVTSFHGCYRGTEFVLGAPDSDGDGITDDVDACPNDAENDADGDGVCGDVDNCAGAVNPAQTDTDGDGIGDVCELDFGVTGTCHSGQVSGFVGESANTEVHLLGVYESALNRGFQQHPRGDLDVNITRTGVPMILVMSSYEPTNWRLNIAEGAIIEQIILNGYYTQTIEGHGDIPVSYKHEPGSYYTACAYIWPSGNGGCDTNALINGVEAELGHEVTSFHGCYASTEFTLGPVGTDSDSDGIFDAQDACPNDADNDIDGDGICGDVDNCPNINNAAQVDNDGDGFGDACDACLGDPTNDADGDGVCEDVDVCPGVSDANQADTDQDGEGDACDACPNDADNDADGDGLCSDVDNCPDIANADQLDNDDDGEGDVCDACPNDVGNDTDSDGLCGDVDNCPDIANADQADGDGDGIGDACDICPFDRRNDADGDGICAEIDNCPRHHNPDQVDNNGDGHGDVCVRPTARLGDRNTIGQGLDAGEDVELGNDSNVGDDVVLGDNADIGDNAQIGNAVEVGDDAALGRNVEVGDGTLIGNGADIENGVDIGAGAHVGNGARIAALADVGNDAVLGEGVEISENAEVGHRAHLAGGENAVRVGIGARVGDDATIDEGTTLGSGAEVGAGAEVGRGVELQPNTSVGAGSQLADNVTVNANSDVGDNANIGEGAIISDYVEVGDDVTVGAGTEVGYSAVVGDNVTFGANGTIRGVVGDNVTIGDRADMRGRISVANNTTIGDDLTMRHLDTIGADGVIGHGFTMGSRASIGDRAQVANNVVLNYLASVGDDAVLADEVQVDDSTQVGNGANIGARTRLYSRSTIGANVTIGQDCIIGNRTTIGDNTVIEDYTIVYREASIGANVIIRNSGAPDTPRNIGHRNGQVVIGDGVVVDEDLQDRVEIFPLP